ncbi:cytokine receptor common subunit beta isoform X2 [Mixophyes fleayi]|uniref:cytokine receptor common subunit beta isoform X2 n=1 Tax=Mixophyes fleayi TaxID=3061075 RepID=UPI003F4E1D4E
MGRPNPVQGLCVLLCPLLYMQGTQGSALLDSLTCVNNYKTHWKCKWKESRDSHRLLPMSLYHWNDLGSKNRQHCDPDNSDTQRDEEGYKTCRINDRFITAMNTKYTFLPERTVHIETRIIPASKVRMSSPEAIMVQQSGNGLLNVSWKMPDYIYSPVSLLYQITYCRKDWETWQDAAVLNVLGNMEVSLSPQLFVPGSTYLFRVRSVSAEHHQLRSTWSKESAWTMPQVNEAAPQNLHCEYDGLTQMRCSWEVRKELVSSLSYTLYYRESPTDVDSEVSSSISSISAKREKSCVSESNQIKDGVPYVQYSCTLQVPSSQANNSFYIQVRPKEEVKTFKPSENIQTKPPKDLQIKDRLSHGYMMRWSQPVVEFSTIQLTYQLCYWKQGDSECPDQSLVNVSGNLPEYCIPSSELQGSTYYTARVRAKPDGKSGYNGPWSDWSQSYSWKTDKVVDTKTICIYAFVISIVLSVCVYQGYKYCNRLRQRWNDSLPNPSKSELLSKLPLGYWNLNLSPFIDQDFYAEKEGLSVCLQISPMDMPESTTEEVEESVIEVPPKPDVCPLGPYSVPPPIEENAQHPQSTCELQDTLGTNDITMVSILQPANNPSKMCYNRLSSTSAHSMSDLEVRHSEYFAIPKSQAILFNLPNEVTTVCQTEPSGGQMGYVLSMEKQFSPQKPQMPDEKRHEPEKNSYFAIPSSSDFQVSPEGPLMITNPDGTGPLVLKQVGDYCFFPELHTSQENLEGKLALPIGHKQQQILQDQPLPVVQAFKVMQRGYLSLEQT